MSQGNLVLPTPPLEIPDRYDPEFMRKLVDYMRAVSDKMMLWAEIADVPTRSRFVVTEFSQSENYSLSGDSQDIEEVRDFLLGLTTALQSKGIVRTIPQTE